MEFRLLAGAIEVYTDAGQPIALAGRRQRSVLGILLMNANSVVTTDRLVDGLWGGASAKSLRVSVHRFISDIRRALGSNAQRLRTVSGGYVFDADRGEIDVQRFEQLVQRGQKLISDEPEKASLVLRQALALWGKAAFEDLLDIPSVASELARLNEVRALAHEDRVEADLALGRHRELIGELEQMVTVSPFRERRWRQLMIALYRADRQAEALRAYGRLQSVLETELGIEPSPELQGLEQMVLCQDPDLRWSPPAGGSRDNLPTHLGPFVGRETALSEIRERLQNVRLVTLCGPGGIGKTRLALETATALRDRFPDGVWWVDLSALAESARVPNQVAQVLGIPEPLDSDIATELIHRLDRKELLLVLDGCEHVIDAVAHFVQSLLSSGPRLRILVTSREQLRVPGEAVWRVPPLQTPPADEEATPEGVAASEGGRMFTELAAAASPGFAITDDNALAIADICRRLEGIPLAIEMAVARTTSMTVHDIAERLGDRLRLLTEGARTAPPHHRTMEAAIDWSYRVLTGSEQALFRRLSVFAGGFTLEAVEGVCSDERLPKERVVGELGRLVDKSLVVPVAATRQSRFRLLGIVRDYASMKLAADEEGNRFDRRYRRWYLEIAKAAFRRVPESFAWHRLLHDEYDNLRAAYEGFSRDGDTEARLRMAGALYWFMAVSGHLQEGAEWVDAALAAARPGDVSTRTLAVGLGAAGSLAATRGRYERAKRMLDESLRRFGEIGHDRGMAWCHLLMARAALAQTAYDEAVDHSEHALRLARGADDPLHTAYALIVKAAATAWPSVLDSGRLPDHRYEEVLLLCREASELSERNGLEEVSAEIQLLRGLIVGASRDPAQGLSMCEAAIKLLSRYGEGAVLADALVAAGLLAIRARRLDRADRLIVDALAISSKTRYVGNLGSALEGLATIRALEGRYESAAVLFGAAEAYPRGGLMALPLDSRRYQDQAHQKLGTTTYRRATREGTTLSLSEAMARTTGNG